MNSKNVVKLLGRILAICCAIYLGILGIRRFDNGVHYSYYYILGGIFFFFALLIILAVLPVNLMVKQFAFLCGHIGLGAFMILTAILVFDRHVKNELWCSISLYSAGAITQEV